MEKEFVPYEIAIKLKEKGFDNDCLAGYVLNRDGITSLMGCGALRFDADGFINPYSEILPAPLWQQVIDWLREKHNLIIWVEARYCFEKKYLWFIHSGVLIKDDIFDLHIETYEEARQAAIEHTLTLI